MQQTNRQLTFQYAIYKKKKNMNNLMSRVKYGIIQFHLKNAIYDQKYS